MNKPKLLITMGCSHTEGFGCWDENTFPNEMKDKIEGLKNEDIFFYLNRHDKNFENLQNSITKKNMSRFHLNGWPMNLAQSMRFDKLINLGRGGSSNSGQVKLFFENNLHKNPYKEYDVLLIWQLTEPFRISFYLDKKIVNLMNEREEIFGSYFKRVIKDKSFELDNIIEPILESIFYFKIIESICEKNNWKMIGFDFLQRNSTLFNRLYETPNFYGCGITKQMQKSGEWERNRSKVCGHLNENGYKILTKYIYNFIKDNNLFEIGTNRGKIDMEYLGNPIEHKL